MTPILFPEWLNANSVRAYPLAENSSRLDITGNVKLPDALIVDAIINVTPVFIGKTVFISSVSVFPDNIGIEISCHDSGGDAVISTITVDVAQHTLNKSYSFVGSGDNASIVGMLAIGDLKDVTSNIIGKFSFAYTATPFEVHALFISSPMVRSVVLKSGDESTKVLTDIVYLKQGENVRLTYEDPNTIRIDALGTSEGFTQQSKEELCSGTATVPVPPPIRTINGYPPDASGNFNIEPSECIAITADVAKLIVSDTCCKPCCGCDELQVLVDGLTTLEERIKEMNDWLNQSQTFQADLLANLTANI